MSRAYNPDTFDSQAVTPLVRLKDNEYILELWHGPTAAFKDLALQILPHLLTTSLVKTGERDEIVVLVGDLGETPVPRRWTAFTMWPGPGSWSFTPNRG